MKEIKSKMKSDCIETWRISDDSFSSILKNSKEAPSSLGKAILALMSENGSKYNQSQSIMLAQNVFESEELYEVNLFVIFLLIWSMVATKGGNLDESKMILNKVSAIDKKLLCAEILATILTTEGFFLSAKGDKTGRTSSYEKALAVKNLNKVHKKKIALDYHGFVCGMGLEKRLYEKIEKIILSISNKTSFARIKYNKFLNSIQIMKKPHCNSFEEELRSDRVASEILSNDRDLDLKEIETYSTFLDNPLKYPFRKFKFSDVSLSHYELWAASMGSLYVNDPSLSLKWARKYISTNSGYFHLNMNSYTLIRAELSNKNCEATKKLMSVKIEKGYPHYLDDFFFARIALLEKNELLARNHIKVLQESCSYYDAYGRLNFELSLACELSAAEIQLFLIPMDDGVKGKNSVQVSKKKGDKEVDLLIGVSAAIQKIRLEIKLVNQNKSVVLIMGETGVGKEVVANAIHQLSELRENPFIPINCGSISDSLLQSELFGHVAGAFTGALGYQEGVFEASKDGTVFLDEIGEVSESVQIALLRVLENNEVRPIGSTAVKKVTCKVIAATNKNLREMVSEGRFREDLYYRLNQFLIEIPPLRERKEDVLPLANHFFSLNRSDLQKPKIRQGLIKRLRLCQWPGNVRQLKNEVEKMRLLNSEKLIYDEDDFPKDLISRKESTKQILNGRLIKNKKLNSIIQEERTPLRRREKIIEYFEDANILTKSEIMKMLNISSGTARTDLIYLEGKGIIERVKPSSSTRSHYFKYILNKYFEGGE